MADVDARAKQVELLAEWSRWMVALESAVCALLWEPLKQQSAAQFPFGRGMLWAWAGFALSTVCATILLGRLPWLTPALLQPEPGGESLRARPRRELLILALAQHALFLTGVLLLVGFVLRRAAQQAGS
ncbi:MAG: hypothetical protein ACJ8DC_16995 [Gemmatimonadales bacterium]